MRKKEVCIFPVKFDRDWKRFVPCWATEPDKMAAGSSFCRGAWTLSRSCLMMPLVTRKRWKNYPRWINCQIRTKIYKVEKSTCLFSILFLCNWPFSDRVADDAMIINLASFIGLRWMFYLFIYEVSTPCKGKWLVSCKP